MVNVQMRNPKGVLGRIESCILHKTLIVLVVILLLTSPLTLASGAHGENFESLALSSEIEVEPTSQSSMYNITFEVVDANGIELEGATVILDGVENVTDNDGLAGFEKEGSETYNYRVKREGYRTVDGEVEVDEDDVEVVVDLSPWFGWFDTREPTLEWRNRYSYDIHENTSVKLVHDDWDKGWVEADNVSRWEREDTDDGIKGNHTLDCDEYVLEDGNHTFMVNVSLENGDDLIFEADFGVDVDPHTVSLVEPEPDKVYNETAIYVDWETENKTADVDSVEVWHPIESNFIDITNRDYFDDPDLEDGSVIMKGVEDGVNRNTSVRVTCEAGHIDTSENVTFSVWSRAPVIEFVRPEDGDAYNDTYQNFKWDAYWEYDSEKTTNPIEGVELEGYDIEVGDHEDDFDPDENETSIPLDESNKNYTATVSVYDNIGHVNETSVNFTIDYTFPHIEIDQPTDGQWITEEVMTVEWSSNPQGLSDIGEHYIEVYNDSVDGENLVHDETLGGEASSTDVSLTESGKNWQIRVYAETEAGQNASANVGFHVDIDAPDVNITQPEDGSVVSLDDDFVEDGEITIEWEYDDDSLLPSGFDKTVIDVIEDGEMTEHGRTFSSENITKLEDVPIKHGVEYVIQLNTTDNAGNEGSDSITFYTVTYETEVELLSPEYGEAFYTDEVSVEWLVDHSAIKNHTIIHNNTLDDDDEEQINLTEDEVSKEDVNGDYIFSYNLSVDEGVHEIDVQVEVDELGDIYETGEDGHEFYVSFSHGKPFLEEPPDNVYKGELEEDWTFDWNHPDDGAEGNTLSQYKIEIASEDDFRNASIVGDETSTHPTTEETLDKILPFDNVSDLDSGEYWWRVTATDVWGNETISEVRKFTYDPHPPWVGISDITDEVDDHSDNFVGDESNELYINFDVDDNQTDDEDIMFRLDVEHESDGGSGTTEWMKVGDHTTEEEGLYNYTTSLEEIIGEGESEMGLYDIILEVKDESEQTNDDETSIILKNDSFDIDVFEIENWNNTRNLNIENLKIEEPEYLDATENDGLEAVVNMSLERYDGEGEEIFDEVEVEQYYLEEGHDFSWDDFGEIDEGKYDFSVSVVNELGHPSGEESETFYYDTDKPEGDISLLEWPRTIGEEVNFTVEGEDLQDIEYFKYQVRDSDGDVVGGAEEWDDGEWDDEESEEYDADETFTWSVGDEVGEDDYENFTFSVYFKTEHGQINDDPADRENIIVDHTKLDAEVEILDEEPLTPETGIEVNLRLSADLAIDEDDYDFFDPEPEFEMRLSTRNEWNEWEEYEEEMTYDIPVDGSDTYDVTVEFREQSVIGGTQYSREVSDEISYIEEGPLIEDIIIHDEGNWTDALDVNVTVLSTADHDAYSGTVEKIRWVVDGNVTEEEWLDWADYEDDENASFNVDLDDTEDWYEIEVQTKADYGLNSSVKSNATFYSDTEITGDLTLSGEVREERVNLFLSEEPVVDLEPDVLEHTKRYVNLTEEMFEEVEEPESGLEFQYAAIIPAEDGGDEIEWSDWIAYDEDKEWYEMFPYEDDRKELFKDNITGEHELFVRYRASYGRESPENYSDSIDVIATRMDIEDLKIGGEGIVEGEEFANSANLNLTIDVAEGERIPDEMNISYSTGADQSAFTGWMGFEEVVEVEDIFDEPIPVEGEDVGEYNFQVMIRDREGFEGNEGDPAVADIYIDGDAPDISLKFDHPGEEIDDDSYEIWHNDTDLLRDLVWEVEDDSALDTVRLVINDELYWDEPEEYVYSFDGEENEWDEDLVTVSDDFADVLSLEDNTTYDIRMEAVDALNNTERVEFSYRVRLYYSPETELTFDPDDVIEGQTDFGIEFDFERADYKIEDVVWYLTDAEGEEREIGWGIEDDHPFETGEYELRVEYTVIDEDGVAEVEHEEEFTLTVNPEPEETLSFWWWIIIIVLIIAGSIGGFLVYRSQTKGFDISMEGDEVDAMDVVRDAYKSLGDTTAANAYKWIKSEKNVNINIDVFRTKTSVLLNQGTIERDVVDGKERLIWAGDLSDKLEKEEDEDEDVESETEDDGEDEEMPEDEEDAEKKEESKDEPGTEDDEKGETADEDSVQVEKEEQKDLETETQNDMKGPVEESHGLETFISSTVTKLSDGLTKLSDRFEKLLQPLLGIFRDQPPEKPEEKQTSSASEEELLEKAKERVKTDDDGDKAVAKSPEHSQPVSGESIRGPIKGSGQKDADGDDIEKEGAKKDEVAPDSAAGDGNTDNEVEGSESASSPEGDADREDTKDEDELDGADSTEDDADEDKDISEEGEDDEDDSSNGKSSAADDFFEP